MSSGKQREISRKVLGQSPLDVLIVEGGASSGGLCSIDETGGRLVPFETWVKDVAAVARQVVGVGSCAALGGIQSARPRSRTRHLISHIAGKTPLITVPGCPARPDQVLLTVATVLSALAPSLQDQQGPKSLFHEVLRPLSRLGDQLTGRSPVRIVTGPGIPDVVRQR